MLQVLNSGKSAEERYAVILGTVPRSIKEALECPPLQDLINSGARVNDLEACLALEIARVSNMLTVGGNLRQGQSLEIARSLIADYPCESLQDFCLCLRNGIKGKYPIDGKVDIFRFDVLVINNWFKAYLAEKYDALVEKLNQERDNDYATTREAKVVSISGFKMVHDQFWVYAMVKNKEARRILWEQEFYRMSQMTARKPSPLTDKDIRKEGKVKPVAKIHPSTPKSIIDDHELHIQYIRDNYDPHTAKPKHGWIPEDQWRENLHQLSQTGDIQNENYQEKKG